MIGFQPVHCTCPGKKQTGTAYPRYNSLCKRTMVVQHPSFRTPGTYVRN